MFVDTKIGTQKPLIEKEQTIQRVSEKLHTTMVRKTLQDTNTNSRRQNTTRHKYKHSSKNTTHKLKIEQNEFD